LDVLGSFYILLPKTPKPHQGIILLLNLSVLVCS